MRILYKLTIFFVAPLFLLSACSTGFKLGNYDDPYENVNRKSHEVNKAIDKMANDIMGDKGPEYTLMDDDVLNNFKSTANRLNTSALKVWATYFDKQVNSVFAHVNHANVKKAESIDSRFADIINYAKLGLALFKEER